MAHAMNCLETVRFEIDSIILYLLYATASDLLMRALKKDLSHD
jgi:hypothetical protein